MNRLIIVGNPFQLIQALFIREKVFCDDSDVTDILIFKSITGCEEFAERITKLGVFRKVILLSETAPKGDRIKKAVEICNIILGHGERISYIRNSELRESDYDEVWYYNYCPWFYGIYDSILNQQNKEAKFVAFMESVFTYTYLRNDELIPPVSRRSRIICKWRRMFKKWVLIPYTGDVYVQYPEMTDEDKCRTVRQLPLLSDADHHYIERVENVLRTPAFENCPRYIFMASSLEFDGFGQGETDLIIRIAEIVGKDNIIVKLHPRDHRGIIERAGIRVMESSNVCWEAIQLVNDFSKNTFFTIASASIVNSALFSGKEIEAYYLYPLINDMTNRFKQFCDDSVKKTIEMAHREGKAKRVRILTSDLQLDDVLNKSISDR